MLVIKLGRMVVMSDPTVVSVVSVVPVVPVVFPAMRSVQPSPMPAGTRNPKRTPLVYGTRECYANPTGSRRAARPPAAPCRGPGRAYAALALGRDLHRVFGHPDEMGTRGRPGLGLLPGGDCDGGAEHPGAAAGAGGCGARGGHTGAQPARGALVRRRPGDLGIPPCSTRRRRTPRCSATRPRSG